MSKKKTVAEKALDEQIKFVDRTIDDLYNQVAVLRAQIAALDNVRENLIHTITATEAGRLALNAARVKATESRK
jgi:prefoldin subunit 5